MHYKKPPNLVSKAVSTKFGLASDCSANVRQCYLASTIPRMIFAIILGMGLDPVAQTMGNSIIQRHFDSLVQGRRNSISSALELRLFCTNPSISRSYLAGAIPRMICAI